MIRLFLFCLNSFVCFSTLANVNFHEGNFNSALAKAKSENKPLLVDAFTTWCEPCKKLDKEVFEDEQAAAFINKYFVAYKLDMEKDEGPYIAMKFRVQAFPSTLFISPGGKLLDVQVGFPGNEGYMEWCSSIVHGEKSPYQNLDANQWQMQFPDFYKYSFTSNQWERKRAKAEEVNAYLSTQKDLSTEVNWSIIKSLAYTKHNYLPWVIENAQKLKNKYPSNEVDGLIQTFLFYRIGSTKKGSLDSMEKRIINIIDSVNPPNKEVLKSEFLIDLYFSRKAHDKVFQEVYKLPSNPKPNLINSICWNVYQDEASTQKQVNFAIAELHQAIAEEPNPNYIDTLAHLYFKAGQKEQAKFFAEKAMEQGKAKGMEMIETENLLQKLE